MNKKVSIVLLNYNGYEDTIACFESLNHISYENYNFVIVDNNSPDNSMDKLVDYMSEHGYSNIYFETPKSAMRNAQEEIKVSLIQSGFNGGYGHGNNIGIKYALKNSADYVLVLNNDTVVEPDFLEPMVQICEQDDSIGIASGKIYFYERPDVIWFNGGGFSPCIAKLEHFNFNEKDVGQVPKEPITFISGCMWLIPKKVFKDVGFINEHYFMYVEDLEFCHRVLKSNYKLSTSIDSKIYHKVGSSSDGTLEYFTVYYRSRNYVLFIKSSLDGMWCKSISKFIFIARSGARLIKNKKYKSIIAMIKGIKHAI